MNEYLYFFRKIIKIPLKDYEEIRWRKALSRKYSWAVPNEETICTIAKYSPLIEIGAGTGYWAMLLRNRDIDITAYDLYPFKENLYHNITQWFPMLKGTAKVLKDNLEKSLLLIWPPYNDIMALECLKWFKGKTLVYIGEEFGGCNATDAFFEKIKKNFKLIKKIKIPQWWNINDKLIVWKRKV